MIYYVETLYYMCLISKHYITYFVMLYVSDIENISHISHITLW